jgi:hypothetical protein
MSRDVVQCRAMSRSRVFIVRLCKQTLSKKKKKAARLLQGAVTAQNMLFSKICPKQTIAQ